MRRGDAKFPAFQWTDDAIHTVRQMAADYSAKVIAEKIGTTRNAVIGKARRMGISLTGTDKPDRAQVYRGAALRRSPAPPKSPPRKLEIYIPAIVRLPPPPAPVFVEQGEWKAARIPFMQIRDGQCRWPLWSGDTAFHEKVFCGLPAITGKEYCPRCRTLAYAPPRQTKQLDDKLGISSARKAA